MKQKVCIMLGCEHEMRMGFISEKTWTVKKSFRNKIFNGSFRKSMTLIKV